MVTEQEVTTMQEVIEIASRMFDDNEENGIESAYNPATGKVEMIVERERVGADINFTQIRDLFLQQLADRPFGQYYIALRKDGEKVTIDLRQSEYPLLSNDEDRVPYDPMWFVDVELALAMTRLQHEMLPLPFMYPGTNLIQKLPTIGQENLEDIRGLIGDDSSPYYCLLYTSPSPRDS